MVNMVKMFLCILMLGRTEGTMQISWDYFVTTSLSCLQANCSEESVGKVKKREKSTKTTYLDFPLWPEIWSPRSTMCTRAAVSALAINGCSIFLGKRRN